MSKIKKVEKTEKKKVKAVKSDKTEKVSKKKSDKKPEKAKRAPPPHDATPITSTSTLVALVGKRSSDRGTRYHAAKFNAKDSSLLEKFAKKAKGVVYKVVASTSSNKNTMKDLPEGKLWKEKGGLFAPFTSQEKYKALR